MGYLLDTHAFLWWISDDERLTPVAVEIVRHQQRVVVSDVTLWEVSIKSSVGKFTAVPDVRTWFERHTTEGRFGALSIGREHLAHLPTLPLHHRDPFDRLLVAQAQIEGLRVVTSDSAVAQYDVEVVW